MANSRVFVRGLPPSINEEAFKKHFASLSPVTDVKLLPHRRIGYVGFRSEEEALHAVKYFNKSYIRMSRISVELADNRLPKSHTNPPISKKESSSNNEFIHMNPLKRKRENNEHYKRVGEAPAGNGNIVNPLEASKGDGISDLYHPSDARRVLETNEGAEIADPEIKTSDTDWMRSRTSRLLGLLDEHEEETSKASAASVPSAETSPPERVTQEPTPPPDDRMQTENQNEGDVTLTLSVDRTDPEVEALQISRRLFIRNLPYKVTEADMADLFKGFGPLEEVHVPMDSRSGEAKGFAFVLFENSENAVKAFRECDGVVFQGRLLHILPATGKRESKLDEYAISKLPVKKQRQIQKKADASNSMFSWNSLFMNVDSVLSSISDRLKVPKSELLDPSSSDAAVKQAQAETHVIQETKAYFAENGVDLNAFKNRERGDTAILIKNFPYGTKAHDLRQLFETHGDVTKVLMPPSGTIAILEFADASQARSAFAALAYRKYEDSVLFLEKAPKGLFDGRTSQNTLTVRGVTPKQGTVDLLRAYPDDEAVNTTTLFVRNLNFVTTNERFRELFEPLDGFISARIKTKPDPKKPGAVLSMGFGFIEFRSPPHAAAALAAMSGYVLDGHHLVLKASHKGHDAAEERRRDDDAKAKRERKSKIIIKNLPFEASKKDVRNLFRSYGQLRAVRVPRKFDNSRKGFAFVEFTNPREAENAMEALGSTHLLGRRLVLDYAAGNAEDPEEELEKMQQKISRQSDNVALQRLASRSERKKIRIGDAREGEDEL